MALSQYDSDYKQADATQKEFEDENKIPDGTYTVEIVNVRHSATDKGDMISFGIKVLEPDGYGRAKCSSSYWFPDNKSSDVPAKMLKFLCEACGIKVVPSDFTRTAILEAFIGYVLTAKKETSKGSGGGKDFVNWKYWKLVKEPQSLVSDGSEYDTDDEGVLDLDNEPDPFA
jgi:hypothetical protein